MSTVASTIPSLGIDLPLDLSRHYGPFLLVIQYSPDHHSSSSPARNYDQTGQYGSLFVVLASLVSAHTHHPMLLDFRLSTFNI
jgi:hypothetical protein